MIWDVGLLWICTLTKSSKICNFIPYSWNLKVTAGANQNLNLKLISDVRSLWIRALTKYLKICNFVPYILFLNDLKVTARANQNLNQKRVSDFQFHSIFYEPKSNRWCRSEFELKTGFRYGITLTPWQPLLYSHYWLSYETSNYLGVLEFSKLFLDFFAYEKYPPAILIFHRKKMHIMLGWFS